MALEDRLSRIETIWSLVQRAHSTSDVDAKTARDDIVNRYGTPIRKYLLGAVKNESDAEDLFQDFTIKLLQGNFQNANPTKGQFRKFIKTILFRMVVDFQRQGNRQPTEIHPQYTNHGESDCEDEFRLAWRSLLVDRTLEQMKKADAAHQTNLYEILKIRLEHPDERSPELALRATRILKRTIKADNYRALLKRSRLQFATMLVDEVAHTLMNPDRETLEDELSELNLLEYCRPLLENRR